MEIKTIEQWCAKVKEDLEAGGFTVDNFKGFPLVKMGPEGSMEDRVKMLEFKVSLPCERRIYMEGMLFVPAGSGTPVR